MLIVAKTLTIERGVVIVNGGVMERPTKTHNQRDRAGLSGFSLKDATRHLAATRLIGAGVDVRTVAGRLGHARASTTLDIYSRFLPERDREAAEVLGALLDAADG